MPATPKASGFEGVHSVQGSFRGSAPKSGMLSVSPAPCTQVSIPAVGGSLRTHPVIGDRGG